jgi:predicted GIY-YIG superfamily endonuclease
MDKDYYVDVLASQRNGTLYVGVTSNLIKKDMGTQEQGD